MSKGLLGKKKFLKAMPHGQIPAAIKKKAAFGENMFKTHPHTNYLLSISQLMLTSRTQQRVEKLGAKETEDRAMTPESRF